MSQAARDGRGRWRLVLWREGWGKLGCSFMVRSLVCSRGGYRNSPHARKVHGHAHYEFLSGHDVCSRTTHGKTKPARRDSNTRDRVLTTTSIVT